MPASSTRLRHCPILMQYHHQEIAYVKRKKVMVVISELVEGQKLSEFLVPAAEQAAEHV